MGDLTLTKKNKKYHQGYYNPKHPQKYVGKLGNVVYRSGLELKFFRFCDNNPNVLGWSSEEIIVEYYDSVQKKNRKYFIDFYIKIKEGDNVKKYLVEVKPWKQTQEPKATKGKKKSSLLYESFMYQNCCDKWKYAKQFAKKHGMEFIIITEKELNQ